jgi:hypothetical protein
VGDRERGRPAASAQAAHAQLVWVWGLAAPRISRSEQLRTAGQGQENQGQNLIEASLSAGALRLSASSSGTQLSPNVGHTDPARSQPEAPEKGKREIR